MSCQNLRESTLDEISLSPFRSLPRGLASTSAKISASSAAAVQDQQKHGQHVLEQACTDAETMVLHLQKQLSDAESARRKAENQEKAALRSIEVLRRELEQKVRFTAQDRQLQINLLQQTVQRLSIRGDQQAEIAKLSREISKLLRSNAKLRSDLMFAQDRVESLTHELEHASNPVTETPSTSQCHGITPAIFSLLKDPANVQAANDFHRLTARLVERAEAAEVELAVMSHELNERTAANQNSEFLQTKGPDTNIATFRVCENSVDGGNIFCE